MVDDFEAALAAADSTPAVEEVIEPTTETAVDVIEEENDENAEFRKALRKRSWRLVCDPLLRRFRKES